MGKFSAARNKSRRFLVQALYQAQIAEVELSEVVSLFEQDHNMKRADLVFFREVLEGINENYLSLVSSIEEIGHRPFTESDPIERGILLIGSFELNYKGDIPYKVVINECIELAKYFGASESFKYINSVLDSLSKTLRPTEYATR
jgi:N utilization substance protein B